MYYINAKQQSILDYINKFGCMRYDQIMHLSKLRDLNRQLQTLIRQRKIKLAGKDIYMPIGTRTVNERILRAIDVYIYLKCANKEIPVQWCETEEFPFLLAVFRNDKVFDIAIIDPGQETLYSAAINRSIAERTIIVINDPIQVDKIKITKPTRYCIVKNNEVSFFEKEGN